jgi:hypothetical protein
MPAQYKKLGHNIHTFHISPNLLLINYPATCHYVIWAADCSSTLKWVKKHLKCPSMSVPVCLACLPRQQATCMNKRHCYTTMGSNIPLLKHTVVQQWHWISVQQRPKVTVWTLMHNNLGMHYWNHNLCDVAWRMPVEPQCTPQRTPFQYCQINHKYVHKW